MSEVRVTYSSVTLHARRRDEVITAAGMEGEREKKKQGGMERRGWKERGPGEPEGRRDFKYRKEIGKETKMDGEVVEYEYGKGTVAREIK